MALNVGVIGVGTMGRRHAENVARLYPKARLLAVADVNTSAARSAADALGCRWFSSPEELLQQTAIQAVVIASSDDTHADLVEAAAHCGKDVLCEKPPALTVASAERASRVAERAGVRLQVGFMRRYDPGYRAAHEAIERGELGQTVIFSAISRDAQPPPRSYFRTPDTGAVFLNSGIHDFDLARWLMRDEVICVSATGAVVSCQDLADVQPIDFGLATLTFRGGALGTVQIYRNAVYGYDIRTEVIGTNATVQIGDHRWRPVQILRREGITHTMPDHWLDRFAEAYALEMADWVERMASDRPPAVTAEDGIRSVAIAAAAEESRRSGQQVCLTGNSLQ